MNLHVLSPTVLVAALLAAPPPTEPPRHVVLISVDGLMPASYTQADALGLAVPNLRRLMKEGAYAEGVVGVLPTVTYPSHTTLITGVPPRVHGITTNMIFDPENRSQGAWNWYAKEIRVPTLVSAAKARSLETASISWPVSVGIGADSLFAEIWRGTSRHPIDLDLLDALGTPGLIDAVGRARGNPFPYPPTDTERVDTAAFVMKTRHPSLLLLHLLEVDFAEHDHGPGSPEALRAVEEADKRVGQMLAAVHDAGLDATTTFVVASDHGFLPVRKALRPNVLLKEAGLIETEGGAIKSWRAFFHSDGGSAALHVKDPALVDKVRDLLAPKLADPASGLAGILDARRIAALGGGTDAALVLDAQDGFMFEAATDGGWMVDTSHRGTHGHSPDRPALRSSLLVRGPGVSPGRDLGIVEMTAIAPTLARVLGVTLSPEAGAPIDLGTLSPRDRATMTGH